MLCDCDCVLGSCILTSSTINLAQNLTLIHSFMLCKLCFPVSDRALRSQSSIRTHQMMSHVTNRHWRDRTRIPGCRNCNIKSGCTPEMLSPFCDLRPRCTLKVDDRIGVWEVYHPTSRENSSLRLSLWRKSPEEENPD
jgi:hypothetical protein